MIIRPKAKVFRLLLGVEAVLLAAMVWTVAQWQRTPSWAYVGLLVLLLLFFLLLLVKIVSGQRKIHITEKTITETHRLFKRQFPLSALQAWEEIRIRTGKAKQYKQLQLFFSEEQYIIKISAEEFEGYDKVYQFLKSRARQKEK